VGVFADRKDAGRAVAALLGEYAGAADTSVLGIPRGGVVVAAEVARELGLPLGVVVTAKVASPENPEYAIGALAPDGVITLDPRRGTGSRGAESLATSAREKIARTLAAFGNSATPPAATAIVVDDGLATGLTALAAVRYLRRLGVPKVILAVPVAATDSAAILEPEVDRFVAAEIPPFFSAVGQFYGSFSQTSDSEVRALLEDAASRGTHGARDSRNR
jgi:putative phosphoribosyl transferase